MAVRRACSPRRRSRSARPRVRCLAGARAQPGSGPQWDRDRHRAHPRAGPWLLVGARRRHLTRADWAPVNGSTRPPAQDRKSARHLGFWVRLLDPARALGHARRGVSRLERLAAEGESFVGAATAIGLAIALQYSLPNRVTQYQRWIFPVVAAVLLLGLLIGHGARIDRSKPWLRGLTLLTVVLMALANAF